ncbi:class I SAM-dependent methyltransferase [Algihabitans albus]|uniref:class I SAM-dependent methyltransferase n=1 Tax=Algihabitans albus TaxID=2164067 RepID=UPI0013C2C1ED|nr:methyltransferase domain-containing protein [Algihabitans albus]
MGFRLISSELAIGAPGETANGVRCENLESLTFSDQEFDLITSTGVMEHVEDDQTAFRETFRTLKPCGRDVFTVPFSYDGQETKLRARREPDGSIHDVLLPEYHGDPFAGDGGVFTWRNYGSDLLDLLGQIGFRASPKHVALPKLPEPMSVFVAQRA